MKPRDPERIPRLLGKLEELWAQSPDLRLFQLLHNMGFDSRSDHHAVEGSEVEREVEQAIARNWR